MGVSLGIIGCQSKHAEFFGEIFNKQKLFNGFSVDYICPVDEPQRLPYVLGLTDIPHVCDSAAELIQRSDAVLVCTRRGETHLEYAGSAMRAGKPVFTDKPFTADVQQAAELVALSRKLNIPLTAGSTICFTPDAVGIKKQIAEAGCAILQYKADPDSEFGGYSFYGSHLTDLCSMWFDGAVAVSALRNGKNVTSTVEYPDRQVVLLSALEADRPQVTALGANAFSLLINDEPCYRCGMEAFVAAMRGKTVMRFDRLVESVKILCAINKSLESGERHVL